MLRTKFAISTNEQRQTGRIGQAHKHTNERNDVLFFKEVLTFREMFGFVDFVSSTAKGLRVLVLVVVYYC